MIKLISVLNIVHWQGLLKDTAFGDLICLHLQVGWICGYRAPLGPLERAMSSISGNKQEILCSLLTSALLFFHVTLACHTVEALVITDFHSMCILSVT